MKVLILISLLCGMFICSRCFSLLPKLCVINLKFNQLKCAKSDELRTEKVAVIIIDHGSKLEDANINLEKVTVFCNIYNIYFLKTHVYFLFYQM